MEVYKKLFRRALDSFAIGTWSDSINNVIFLFEWRTKLAKYTVFIKLTIDIVKALKVNSDIWVLGIQDEISVIFKVIALVVENRDC